ncbi:MAG: DUF4382 domain-containing protein [Gammaproteobacteria bacterium]|nr:DUF4382 domain-containing protein [Gammaproteobacteria bacterium]NNJ48800.1 DUF4382 domain-containing protein [Gammaproteobacteria bacterium]
MKLLTYLIPALLSTSILIACSSGSNESDSISMDGDTSTNDGGRGGTQNGFLTLSITDAPIDDAIEVWVQFDGIELKPSASDEPITLTFNPPMSIDLLTLQGQSSAPMLTNQTLPTGTYDWLRLKVTAVNDGILDSYIKLSDNSVHELDIPGGSESGLKVIGGLEVIANTPTSMTIDFDLRKSIVMTSTANYELNPVLKLVDDATANSIIGTVELSALTGTDCPDADPSTGNAIYLYKELNVTPDDVGSFGSEPVSSALVAMNNISGVYEYEFGFIPLGKYTLAFTCQADLDDPMNDDAIVFSKPVNLNLASMQTKIVRTFR